MSKIRSWRILALAWAPLVVLYPLAVAALYPDPVNFGVVLQSVFSIFLAGVLAAGAWWISGRFARTGRLGWKAYVTHIAVGLAYAATWWMAAAGARALFRNADPLAAAVEAVRSVYFPWNLLFGLLTYGLFVGLSYTVRSEETLREERLNAARAEALAARAQLTALQSQLNPHFLFNALHTLSALFHESPGTADDALDRLGSLLRYALYQAERETVSLREEWDFAQDYLAIEQLRLGDRLRVESMVDHAVLGSPVPPFCIQPLIENAIRHGIAPRPRGGCVRVRVGQRDGDLLIDVRDDGTGATREAVEQSRGHGLRALRQRLAAHASGAAALEIETPKDGGFVARVRLPVSAPSEAADR